MDFGPGPRNNNADAFAFLCCQYRVSASDARANHWVSSRNSANVAVAKYFTPFAPGRRLPQRGSLAQGEALACGSGLYPCARSSKRAGGGYFSFVKTLSPPRLFTVIWFFAASNVKTATPSIWNLSSAVASRGTADDAPGG